MFKRIGLVTLAFAGIGFAIFMIFWSRRTPPAQPILFQPPKSPYKHYVAGEGIIESHNENVRIGTSFPDLIWDVFAHAGDIVLKGTPLFKLDTRQQEADLKQAVQELGLAKTNFENQKAQFSYYQDLDDKNAVSKQEYTPTLFTMIEFGLRRSSMRPSSMVCGEPIKVALSIPIRFPI